MAVNCQWALLCDYAFLDSGGKLCVIGIFDRIYAKSVPTIHVGARLVAQLAGGPSERFRIKVQILRPTASTLKSVDGSGETSPEGGAGVHLDLSPLHLPDYGKYRVNIFLDDEPAGLMTFSVLSPPASGPS